MRALFHFELIYSFGILLFLLFNTLIISSTYLFLKFLFEILSYRIAAASASIKVYLRPFF